MQCPEPPARLGVDSAQRGLLLEQAAPLPALPDGAIVSRIDALSMIRRACVRREAAFTRTSSRSSNATIATACEKPDASDARSASATSGGVVAAASARVNLLHDRARSFWSSLSLRKRRRTNARTAKINRTAAPTDANSRMRARRAAAKTVARGRSITVVHPATLEVAKTTASSLSTVQASSVRPNARTLPVIRANRSLFATGASPRAEAARLDR